MHPGFGAGGAAGGMRSVMRLRSSTSRLSARLLDGSENPTMACLLLYFTS